MPPAQTKDETKDLVRVQKVFTREGWLQVRLKVALAPTQPCSIGEMEPRFTWELRITSPNNRTYKSELAFWKKKSFNNTV